jgi:hypothetical protein
MAHLIPSNGGLRFSFSHDFSDLLVSQMEATLESQDINVRRRSNKLPDGQFKSLADSLADDHIHCPLGENFEMMSFYEMMQQYKKVFKSLQREGEDRDKFCETHPGYEFSYLMKLKHPTIPRIALPKEKLCPLKDLQLNTTKPTEESFDKCEIYANKLQGMSKDVIIVTSWPTGFKNWEYIVLSRARTLSGLYLVEPINMNKSFKPSNELKRYVKFARLQESNLLKKGEDAMSAITWL